MIFIFQLYCNQNKDNKLLKEIDTLFNLSKKEFDSAVKTEETVDYKRLSVLNTGVKIVLEKLVSIFRKNVPTYCYHFLNNFKKHKMHSEHYLYKKYPLEKKYTSPDGREFVELTKNSGNYSRHVFYSYSGNLDLDCFLDLTVKDTYKEKHHNFYQLKMSDKDNKFSVCFITSHKSSRKGMQNFKGSFSTNDKNLFLSLIMDNDYKSQKVAPYENSDGEISFISQQEKHFSERKFIINKTGKKIFICLLDSFLYCYNMNASEICDLVKKLSAQGIKIEGIRLESELMEREKNGYHKLDEESIKPLINAIKTFNIKFISIDTGSIDLFDLLSKNLKSDDCKIVDTSNKKTNDEKLEINIPDLDLSYYF